MSLYEEGRGVTDLNYPDIAAVAGLPNQVTDLNYPDIAAVAGLPNQVTDLNYPDIAAVAGLPNQVTDLNYPDIAAEWRVFHVGVIGCYLSTEHVHLK